MVQQQSHKVTIADDDAVDNLVERRPSTEIPPEKLPRAVDDPARTL